MNEEASKKLALLTKLIELEMKTGTIAGSFLKRRATWYKATTIICSALVTVLLGLNSGEWGKWIALIFSTVVTSLSAWETFTNYNQRSVQESMNVNRMYMLYKEALLYKEGNEDIKMEEYLGLKKKYEQIHEEYIQEKKSLIDKDGIQSPNENK